MGNLIMTIEIPMKLDLHHHPLKDSVYHTPGTGGGGFTYFDHGTYDSYYNDINAEVRTSKTAGDPGIVSS